MKILVFDDKQEKLTAKIAKTGKSGKAVVSIRDESSILNDEFIDSLWEIQSNIEHSILMIKLCLNDDVVFSPQQDSQITEIKEIVQESLKAIKNSLQHMGNDEHVKALNDLRYGGHLIKNTLAKIRRKKITY